MIEQSYLNQTILTGTITSGQSGPGHERVLQIPQNFSLDLHHQMQFNVILMNSNGFP